MNSILKTFHSIDVEKGNHSEEQSLIPKEQKETSWTKSWINFKSMSLKEIFAYYIILPFLFFVICTDFYAGYKRLFPITPEKCQSGLFRCSEGIRNDNSTVSTVDNCIAGYWHKYACPDNHKCIPGHYECFPLEFFE